MPRRAAPTPPRLRDLHLPELHPGAATAIHPHGSYEALAFTGDDFTGADLSDVGFSGCSFADLNVHELELTGARITSSYLTVLDVPTLSAAYAQLREVLIGRSRLGVLQCIEGSWDSVHVRDSKLGYVSLRGATVHDVLFTDCVIGELDLTGAAVQRLSFADTEVGALDVSEATLTDVDLRTLDLPDITGLAHLRGATINDFQLQLLAPSLAELLGIDVAG